MQFISRPPSKKRRMRWEGPRAEGRGPRKKYTVACVERSETRVNKSYKHKNIFETRFDLTLVG